MSESVKFAVGGAVQVKQGTYLKRPADEELFNVCRESEFSYVLACRQIGKSSLMLETAGRLQQAGVRTASIDLNAIGQQNLSAEQWYFSLIDELSHRLGLETDTQAWWENRPSLSSMSARFLQFFRDVVLQEIKKPLVIFIDEIDTTLRLPFTDDFFAAVRTIYNERMQETVYQRLTFVLLGVATPDELIKDTTRTPFNIGQAITLQDFTEAECTPFRARLEAAYPRRGGQYFDQIYAWTNGHPYLSQKLCQAVLEAAADDQPNLVDLLVRNIFLAADARSDDNIQYVQSRIRGDDYAQQILRLYKRILEADQPVPDDERSPAAIRAKLYGLLVEQGGYLKVRNKIYAQAFDKPWVDKILDSVRSGVPNKYTILQRIKERGFITVYMAQDTETRQLVALKVLHIRDEDETEWSEWLDQVEQEAKIVAASKHPNIIQIHETGHLGSNAALYIDMEYITGGTLRDRLKQGPLPRNEAVALLRQIGAALSHAHERNILHLGVNSQEILLDTTEQPMRPVLTDFGFARLLPAAPQFQGRQDYRLLNDCYLAPEQERQETPTPATDVYGLAVTFFEMLAGGLPPDKQSGDPLPPVSAMTSDGELFDPILIKATAGEPADRYQTTADFVEAVEAANQQIEQLRKTAHQAQAASAVELAKSYIQSERYDPERAMSMVEIALEMAPDYRDALQVRGKIHLEQKEFEKALADYEQAYAPVQDPLSEVGLEYLQALERVADDLWDRQKFLDAVEYYQRVRHMLGGYEDKNLATQQIWRKVHTRLIEYHYRQGDQAYVSRSSKSLEEVIEVLDHEIESLEALQADRQIKDLRNKSRQLRIEMYQQAIQKAQASIETIAELGSQVRFKSEEIFQHYATIDQAYDALLDLDAKNEVWRQERNNKLIEQAQAHTLFADRALNKFEPDYVSALRHYNAILEIGETKYSGLAQKLHLDLNQKIADIQEKADYDGKYQHVHTLVDDGEYLKALEYLDQAFIKTGNYEHRDVARLLWGLVHAKQNEGEFPVEWEGSKVLKPLRERLSVREQTWLHQLKSRLYPWSLDNISGTLADQYNFLDNYEADIQSIEALLEQAVEHGVADTAGVQTCREEAAAVRDQIVKQRQALQIDQTETGQKFDIWLQRVRDIEKFLHEDNSIGDIPEFLNRVDQERDAIEQDPIFTATESLLATNADINQAINQMKLSIKRRLVEILIDDVGRRDDALTKLRVEVTAAQAEATTLQQRTDTLQGELTAAQGEAAAAERKVDDLQAKFNAGQDQARDLESRLDSAQQQEKTLEARVDTMQQRGAVNKYVIPLALAAAVVTGAFIAPRLPDLTKFRFLGWIAVALLLAYAGFFAWFYYISQASDK